jgi:predicted nucleic acid-binding protein
VGRRRRRPVTPEGGTLLLDSEGLSKAAQGDLDVIGTVGAAEARDLEIAVSAVTLAEVLRGGRRDASVHALLRFCRVSPVSAEIGREAGELLGRTGRKDTIDAIVAATAATLPTPVRILTSDQNDLGGLTEGMAEVLVEAV